MTVFEDLERVVNTAVVAALANCEAVIEGAVRVRCLFEAHPSVALGMVDSVAPAITLRQSDWPNAARGDEVTICGDVYRVIGVESDGTGLARLSLERQS